MRILIISPYYWPETFAAGTYLCELAEFLVSQGHEVTVQTAFPHYPEGVVWPQYRWKFGLNEIKNGVSLRRSFILAIPRKHLIILRSLTSFTFALSSFFSSLFNGKQDIIYTLFPILPIGFMSILLGKIKRCPVILGVKDLLTEGLIQTGKLQNKHLKGLIAFFEYRLYISADHIQVPTSNQQRYLNDWGLPIRKVTLIPDWADSNAILPMPKENDFRKEYGLEGKFVLVYSGNMGYSSELETVLYSANLLRSITDIFFLLIGDGPKREGLERFAIETGLTNVKFLPFQDRKNFFEVLAAADFGLITLNRKCTIAGSQGKMYSIMASARPLLAIMEKEAWGAEWIDKYRIGSRVDPGDAEGLARTILTWKVKPDELIAAGNRGRHLLEEKYNIKVCGTLFVDLFNDVSKSKARSPNTNRKN